MQVLMEAVFQTVREIVGRGRDRKKEKEEEGKKMGREGRGGGEENRYYERKTESQKLLRSWSQTTARLSGNPALQFHEIFLIPVTICPHSYKLAQFPF